MMFNNSDAADTVLNYYESSLLNKTSRDFLQGIYDPIHKRLVLIT